MDIKRLETQNEALDAASAKLDAMLEKAEKNASQKNTLLLLSGGDSLKILNRVSDSFLGDHLTVTVLDERYGSEDEDVNFFKLQETYFYEDARNSGVNFIDTSARSSESLQEAAERIEGKISEWMQKNPDGYIMATLGLGNDGHIAGIMPYDSKEEFSNLFEKKGVWIVGYDVGDKNEFPKRITTTISFLRNIEYALMYVVGEEKANVLSKVLSEKGDLNETPGRIIQAMENITIFTDVKE